MWKNMETNGIFQNKAVQIYWLISITYAHTWKYFHPRLFGKKSGKNLWNGQKSIIHFGNWRYQRICLLCSSWINNWSFMINLTHPSLSQNHNITFISKCIFVIFSFISAQFLKKCWDYVTPELPCPLACTYSVKKMGPSTAGHEEGIIFTFT